MTTAEVLARKLCEEKREEIRQARKVAEEEQNGPVPLKSLPGELQRTAKALRDARTRVHLLEWELEQAQLTVDRDGNLHRTYNGVRHQKKDLDVPFTKRFSVLNKLQNKVCVDLLDMKTVAAKQRLEQLRVELEKV